MIIHALNHTNNNQLKSLLQVRSRQGTLSTEQKSIIMKSLADSKSLEYTLEVLRELQGAIETRLQEIESGVRERKNFMLRKIMAKFAVEDPITSN
jgi:hypothetical protein